MIIKFYQMKLLLLCFSVFTIQFLYAQQYMIRYDLQNEKTAYFKIESGDTSKVKQINVKKSNSILVHVDNYNPFYWNAKVTAYKDPLEDEVGFGQSFNPISVLAQGLGGLMGSIPLLDLPKSRGREDATTARGRFINTLSDYMDSYSKIQEINEKYEQILIAKLQLKDLKYDFTRTEADIKFESAKAIQKVLGNEKPEMQTVINLGKKYVVELDEAIRNATRLKSEMQVQLTKLDGTEDLDGQNLLASGEKAIESYTGITKLKALKEKDPNFIVQEMVSLVTEYRDIRDASFNYFYTLNRRPDISDVKIEIYPKAVNSTDTIVRYFQLNGKRNIRIRNSVGIAFTHFDQNNTEYYITTDSIIKTGNKDLFTPVISTLIHFYAGKRNGIKWGGAFGFGIPITGEKKDVNFFLGLSAGFGQNEPLMITMGLAGAKVNKLSHGYEEGGKVNTTRVTDLTTSGYGLGAYMSISFNLSNLSVSKK